MAKNATSFKKNDPRINTKGKKAGTLSITTRVREALLKIGEGQTEPYDVLLAKKVLQKAIKEGDVQMIKTIWSYIDGMPVQKIGGDSENPLVVQISEVIAKKYGINSVPDNNSK